jgi:hypothetical protein
MSFLSLITITIYKLHMFDFINLFIYYVQILHTFNLFDIT